MMWRNWNPYVLFVGTQNDITAIENSMAALKKQRIFAQSCS